MIKGKKCIRINFCFKIYHFYLDRLNVRLKHICIIPYIHMFHSVYVKKLEILD